MGVKLGQKWAVKDGNLLASNQVGSRFFNKEFDFSRASNGTYVDRDGLLKTAELYNKLSYSEDFTQAYWTKSLGIITQSEINSPTGSINTNLFTKTSAVNTVSRITRSSPYSTTGNHTFSVYIKQNVGNEVLFRFDSNGNSANATFLFDTKTITLSGANIIDSSVLELSNGWFKIVLTANILSTSWGLDIVNLYSNPTNDSVYIFGAQLVLGTEPLDYQYTNGLQGLPRISFEDGVGHLLLEPQRSNLLLQSNSFDTTWSVSNSSVTSGQSGIYGSNNAWLLSTAIPTGYLAQSISVNSVKTFSIYAKAGNTDGLVLRLLGGSNPYVFFSLTDGSYQGAGGIADLVSYNSTSIGNGWYRFEITTAIACTFVRVYCSDSSGEFASGSIYIQHAQLESGSYPTSIIETTTSQVTRTADVANNCGTEQDFNSEEGVLYAEIQKLVENNDLSSFDIISINDNSSNNMIAIGFDNEDDVYARIRVGGVNIFTENSTFIGTNKAKLALKYKSGDIAVWLNGVEIVTNASGFTFSPNTLSNLSFDYGTSGENFYGKVRNLQVFTEALSDAELQQLTT